MALGFLATMFGRRVRLPRDKATRLPRAVKKAAAAQILAVQHAVDAIAAMPGIADVKQTKRVPRGFYAKAAEVYRNVDGYHGEVRKHLPVLQENFKRPGEPGGTGGCYATPMGLSAVEHLAIYQTIRTWRDFPQVAKRLGELAELQFKDIQANHTGKDPEKIRMGGKAIQQGRLMYAKRMEPCAFLDVQKQRCRVWDVRPMVCRMHHATTPPEWSRPDHEKYPEEVEAKNLRLPIRVQVALSQLDKRLMLQLSPFMTAGLLQILQLAEGQLIQEVGEAPARMQQDGVIAQKANRNVAHAKKFQKGKGKKKK